MGNCCAALKAMDLDKVFAYSTVKIVKIQDRRLGITHKLFLLGIFIYVFGWTLIHNKRYLLRETPVGTVRMSLQKPAHPSNPEDLPYCLTADHGSTNGFENWPCRYWDETLVEYPTTEEYAMHVASRITAYNYTLPADCYDWSRPSCAFESNGKNDTFFIADIENYTFMMDHTMYAVNLGIQRNAQNLSGELVDTDGHVMTGSNIQVGVRDKLDIMSIDALLKAAGIDSLDSASGASNTKHDTDRSSKRFAGIILLVIIEYSNVNTFHTSHISYTVKVRHIKNTEFKGEQLQYAKYPGDFLKKDRHGIRIIIQQSGTIGEFDFQTMLLSLVSGLGLMAVATVVVDFAALSIMPQREAYKDYKYLVTADFSDVRDGTVTIDSYDTDYKPKSSYAGKGKDEESTPILENRGGRAGSVNRSV